MPEMPRNSAASAIFRDCTPARTPDAHYATKVPPPITHGVRHDTKSRLWIPAPITLHGIADFAYEFFKNVLHENDADNRPV